MNIRPHAGPDWPNETTLPIPLLTGADRAREFANTEAAVRPFEPQPMPAEACTELGADTKPPRVLDTLRRQRAITAVIFVALAAVVCGVCVAGYLRVPMP